MKHKNRQLISKALGAKLTNGEFQKGGLELWVELISLRTGLSQPLVSYHLKIMKEGGLAASKYKHPKRYWSLSENFAETANRKAEKVRILGKNQKRVLEFIKGNPSLRPKDICPGMCSVMVSQALKRLREKGLVSFTTSRNVKRARFYSAIT